MKAHKKSYRASASSISDSYGWLSMMFISSFIVARTTATVGWSDIIHVQATSICMRDVLHHSVVIKLYTRSDFSHLSPGLQESAWIDIWLLIQTTHGSEYGPVTWSNLPFYLSLMFTLHQVIRINIFVPHPPRLTSFLVSTQKLVWHTVDQCQMEFKKYDISYQWPE